jgi:hypothetical protein
MEKQAKGPLALAALRAKGLAEAQNQSARFLLGRKSRFKQPSKLENKLIVKRSPGLALYAASCAARSII